MTMPVNEKMLNDGDAIYYDDNLRTMLESHMAYLRGHQQVSVVPVDPLLAYKYTGDLQGLLLDMNYQPCYHWFLMRLNDMDSFEEVSVKLTSLRVVPPSVVDQLVSIYRTIVNKIA